MLRGMMILGMSMTVGSGLLGFEAKRQIAEDPQAEINMFSLLEGLQGQVVNLARPAEKRDVRQANLPQVKRRPTMQTMSMSGSSSDDWGSMTNQQQIDDLVNSSPQLKALVKADKETSRQSFWSRVRQKVGGNSSGGRLSDINKRNAPPPPPRFSMEDIGSMSPDEIVSNMGEVQRSIQGEAAQNIGMMKFP